MGRRAPFFYGWVMVGIALFGMALIYGIRNSFSVFFPPILEEFGWARGSTAIMFSLNLLIYGLLAPVAGTFGDRWKPRRMMLLGITLLALATAGSAFAQELWHFYLLFGLLMPIGTALSGWPLLGPALANWFAKRRGLAVGLGQMGGGLSFVFAFFAEFVITQLGWRGAFLVLAGIVFAVLMPVYLFLFHYRPEEKGLKAYGAAELVKEEVTASSNPHYRDWTLGQAMKTYQLWLFVLCSLFLWGMGAYLVLAHQVKFAQDVGFSSTFAASVFALYGVAMAGGQLCGFISDWLGREKTFTLGTLLAVGALISLISVSDTSRPWLLYIYALFFGYGIALCTPALFAGMADLFHGSHFGAIAGLLLTGMGVGGAIGPWLGGYIYDVTGSYTGAFLLSLACIGLACVSFWIAAPRKAARLRSKE